MPITLAKNAKDLTGRRFGRLVVTFPSNRVPRPRGGDRIMWECRCDCGSKIEADGGNLVAGNTKSCGCLRAETTSRRRRTHGASRTPEHNAWTHMLARCRNQNVPEYPYYGGRGIEVRFASFEEFFSDIGARPTSKHSVDRIDVNGHYERGNVRWATHPEQCANKRSNRLLTARGRTMCTARWAREVGSNAHRIEARLKNGWSHEDAIFKPKMKNKFG